MKESMSLSGICRRQGKSNARSSRDEHPYSEQRVVREKVDEEMHRVKPPRLMPCAQVEEVVGAEQHLRGEEEKREDGSQQEGKRRTFSVDLFRVLICLMSSEVPLRKNSVTRMTSCREEDEQMRENIACTVT